MTRIGRFSIQTGKGVKQMKKFMVLPIFALLGVFIATSAFAVSDTVSVSASVQQGTASIAIKDSSNADLTAMAFGSMTASATNHRKKETTPADGARVEFFSGGGTYEMRVWYDNFPTSSQDPTKAVAGLKATVGIVDYFWPHKIWCPNFGPTGATQGPDPNTDSYWTGASANYKWVYEKAYKVDGFGLNAVAGYPSGSYKSDTRTTLTWYYPTGTSLPSGIVTDARLASGFRVDIAIDSLDAGYAGATATSYSGTLVFDLTQNP